MCKSRENPQFYLHLIRHSGTFWSPFNCIISILTLTISAITSVAKDTFTHCACQLARRLLFSLPNPMIARCFIKLALLLLFRLRDP